MFLVIWQGEKIYQPGPLHLLFPPTKNDQIEEILTTKKIMLTHGRQRTRKRGKRRKEKDHEAKPLCPWCPSWSIIFMIFVVFGIQKSKCRSPDLPTAILLLTAHPAKKRS
jgi:hypothetical protein